MKSYFLVACCIVTISSSSYSMNCIDSGLTDGQIGEIRQSKLTIAKEFNEISEKTYDDLKQMKRDFYRLKSRWVSRYINDPEVGDLLGTFMDYLFLQQLKKYQLS